ncbi:hypothetical protein D3C75_490410 [compost metagenome]
MDPSLYFCSSCLLLWCLMGFFPLLPLSLLTLGMFNGIFPVIRSLLHFGLSRQVCFNLVNPLPAVYHGWRDSIIYTGIKKGCILLKAEEYSLLLVITPSCLAQQVKFSLQHAQAHAYWLQKQPSGQPRRSGRSAPPYGSAPASVCNPSE